MDPELLRVLTDPAARADPARVKAAMRGMHRSTRQSVLGSVRVNNLAMSVVGAVLLLAGLACFAVLPFAGALPTELATVPLGIGALLFVLGAVFFGLSRLFVLPSRSLLTNGARGQAIVRQVKSVGRTIGIKKSGLSATVSRITVTLAVSPEAGAPFEIDHAEMMLSSDLGQLQNGATLPIRHLASDPRRLAIDWDALEG
jgi:hypothetical protein